MVRSPRLAFLLVLATQFLSVPCIAAGESSQPAQEARVGSLDVVLLLDKSLSMAPYFMEAKEYAAGQVIGPVLVPGDRLIIELVYGKVQRLVSMSISSEADKATAIRAIREVKADGRFTDLGAALDAAKRDLDELGMPERPKYVLMITDERQEAPAGSPYQATDYKLRHPSLEYVKKLDLGNFRAITVGLQVKDKVAQTAPEVMKLLLEPPLRGGALVGGSSGSVSGGSGARAPDDAAAPEPGSSAAARAAMSAVPSWAFVGAAAILVLAAAGLAAALVISRKNRRDKGSTEA